MRGSRWALKAGRRGGDYFAGLEDATKSIEKKFQNELMKPTFGSQLRRFLFLRTPKVAVKVRK